ncbi:MAG: DUF1003 domain-containing protein [Myxococcota bacterium]
MATTADALAGVPFFALLDESERAVLAERVEIVTVSAGTVLFEAGDPGEELYVVLEGQVEVYFRDTTGQRIVLETADKGEFFGEISLLDPGPRTAAASVTRDLTAIVVDREDLDELFRLKPGAALDLLTATGRRLRTNAELLRKTASRNVNLEEEERSFFGRAADWIVQASGSMAFLVMHVVFFAIWIWVNRSSEAFDPYPFGFLTMVVSLEAILLSVFVLLSQNRQAARDQIRNDIEYKVNLKAELEIAHLHEKVDRLHAESFARMDKLAREVRAATGHKPHAAE